MNESRARTAGQFVIAFHGCEESVGREIIAGDRFIAPSTNRYDWLGHGAYFWENDYQRALEWAEANFPHAPFAIGAFIDLGRCFNLIERRDLELLRSAHDELRLTFNAAKRELPNNRGTDLGCRELDCLVINAVHNAIAKQQRLPFDTVRAAFVEGAALYEGAAFREQNHVQICVRNTRCITGFFLPREDSSYPHWLL